MSIPSSIERIPIVHVAVCADVASGAPRGVRGLHLHSREHPRQAGEGEAYLPISINIDHYLPISTTIYLYLLISTAGGDADGGSKAWDTAYQPCQDLP